MLQDTHGSFATYFHKYLAILVIDVKELYFPRLSYEGEEEKQISQVYAHFRLMEPVLHQSPLRRANYILWNEGSLQIFTAYQPRLSFNIDRCMSSV